LRAAGGQELTRARDMALPWDAMMRFAFGCLRLSPDMFWRMTVKEFACLCPPGTQSPAPDRAALAALMSRYPDERPDHRKGRSR
jgi:uncharacterized phage protein (TIGR02216 family)